MRFVKAVFMIALWVPCFARADGGDVSVANMPVPVSRIDNAVQSYLDLHDSVFVFLLRDKIKANGGSVTLKEVAQLCVNALGQAGIGRCQDFMRDVIGDGVSGTDEVFVAHFNPVGTVSFEISAQGTFYVDCGNDEVQTISINGAVSTQQVECPNTSEIKISGNATGYSDDENTPVINFINNTNLTKVSGSLGKIFPTLSDGTSPRFVGTFWGCENLTDISGFSFDGIEGEGVKNMFWGTFGKTGITSIPDGLFSGLTNASAERMFAMAFYGCDKLESIPENLFKNVDVQGDLPDKMFLGTFAQCSTVSGHSPKIGRGSDYLGQIAAWRNTQTACFCNANDLANYNSIDNNWK